jgi:2-C-methyl-D-erythritol 2,4-cyclodiphosphate synthase
VRIGQGFDVHAFREGGRLILGGVEIAHSHGLAAHSDGDVLLHALCDALLGAAGLGDIGRHFPDTDAAYQGIDSRKLLRAVMDKVRQQGLLVGNADITVVAQAPKLAPHVEAMCGNIAADLGVERGRVNVKATTTEHLGFTGRREGIAAFAVVLLEER